MSEVNLSNEIKLIIPRKLVLIFLLFSAAIILVGIYYYKAENKRHFKGQENSLSSIANLKIGEIEHWHKERLGDAATIKENELLKNRIYTAVLGTILIILITTSIFGFWIWNHRIRLFRKQVKIKAKFRDSEEKLRNSEELFSKLFHNMLNGFAYCKMLYGEDNLTDFIFINVNDAFESLTGLKNVNGKKVSEVIPGIQQSDPDLLKRYHRVALTGKSEVFETWVESMKMWFLISVYSPQKEYFVAVFDVITERKLREEVLREDEERFRSLFENAQVAMYRSKLDGSKLITVNTKFCEIFGNSVKEMLDDPATIRWADPVSRDQMINELREIESLQNYRINIINKRGEIRTCSVSVRMYNDKGYIEGSAIDITDNLRSETELRLKNLVFNASIAANSISDINGTITEVNDAFLKVWGYPDKDHVIGKAVSDFMIYTDETASILAALQKTGEWEGDYTARRMDDSAFFAHGLSTIVRDETGKTIGYQSAVLDITERKNQEEEIRLLNEELEKKVIRRTEQFEAANKELEAFSYSVSHDLRAPLRAVHSYTNILMEEYEDKLDDEGKRLCRIISSGAIKMGGLIDDLLSFSRIGRSTLNPAVLEMTSIVKSGLDEASDECRKNNITFTIGNLHKVKGDPGLIKLVWNNLISNAIKYSSKANNPEIKIGSVQENGSVTYYVRDNGVGFDMQYEHKLFGVFQRLHSEREFEGNGVGLAIVQRIILKHNGKVWAEGEVGKGATFYFSLPDQDNTQQATGERSNATGIGQMTPLER